MAAPDRHPGVWPVLVRLGGLVRRGLGLAGLLVAAWLVLAGVRVLGTGEGGGTWLSVAAVCWLVAALRWSPLVLLRTRVSDMHPTLPGWATPVGVSGLGYVLVGPRHGELAVLWIHPIGYPAGERYPRVVQRIFGLPGDRVAIRNGRVWRNGALLDEPYCQQPFPANFQEAEYVIPPGHYLVLPDRRADGSPQYGTSPEGAGWLMGREHLLGRVWFHPAEGGGVRTVPRHWPWLDPLGLLVGPVVLALAWCYAQVRGRCAQPAPGDDEPARVHMLCDTCRGRWCVSPPHPRPRPDPLQRFYWVTPTGLRTPRRHPGVRE